MYSLKKSLNPLLISTVFCHEDKDLIWRILLKTHKEICIKTETNFNICAKDNMTQKNFIRQRKDDVGPRGEMN
jgi:hypothetical protein